MYTSLESTTSSVTEADACLKTVDAMLKAARTSLNTSRIKSRLTHPSLKTISSPPQDTDTNLQAIHIDREANASSVLNVIKRRRSTGQVLPDSPTRAQIECLLEAATYAPNHHVTEPWQFWVLTGAAREQLGAVLEESLRQRLEQPLDEKAQRKLLGERSKPLRAPVIITVGLRSKQHKSGDPIENIEAIAAAVQNMLLTAEDMGLATIWRTGDPTQDPLVKQWFGLGPDDQILAFIYVGYPKIIRPMRVPTPFTEKTIWLS